jgi:hypothetical protein
MKSKISNLDKEQFEHGPMSESTIVDNIQALVTYRQLGFVGYFYLNGVLKTFPETRYTHLNAAGRRPFDEIILFSDSTEWDDVDR